MVAVSVFRLLGTLLLCSCGLVLNCCDFGWGGTMPIPQPAAFLVHIESIEQPDMISAGVPFDLNLRIYSGALQFDHPMAIAYRSSSASFDAGVASGTYESGRFVGLYLRQVQYATDIGIGLASPEVKLPLIFEAPGRHVVYLSLIHI